MCVLGIRVKPNICFHAIEEIKVKPGDMHLDEYSITLIAKLEHPLVVGCSGLDTNHLYREVLYKVLPVPSTIKNSCSNKAVPIICLSCRQTVTRKT